jgi:hypothetical protein
VNDKSIFPITEEVVDANVHLTEACWTTFRKRVENKGCKAKRRVATVEERAATGDKRKGKMYVISITCPVHPSKALEDKAKKEAAAVEKKKKAEEAAERKARLAELHKEKVAERYASIVGQDDGDTKTKTPGKTKTTGLMDSFVNVKVTAEDLLQHAMTVHNKRQTEIRLANQSEERKLMSELMKKHEEEKQELRRKMKSNEEKLIAGAETDYEEVKGKIEEACAKKPTAANFVTPSASAKKAKK